VQDLTGFQNFFNAASSGSNPERRWLAHPFQARLATQAWPETLIIPTGFGKTAAVLAAWLWKRAHGDPSAPTRLVYCLPMRTLVEQTCAVAECWAAVARSHFTQAEKQAARVHVLMGGSEAGASRGIPDWIMNPDRPAILVGTQDMLISGALMRGYGASRFRWPVDFALLNSDALWVMDEVQLAGAGLPTSAQMEAFRRERGTPSRTLWMSATLDPCWLKTPNFYPADVTRPHDLTDEDLAAAPGLWQAKKHLAEADIAPPAVPDNDASARSTAESAYAAAVARFAAGLIEPGRTVLVFLNRVRRAQQVYQALEGLALGAGAVTLLHSRFRKDDRQRVMRSVLANVPDTGRIVVTTQALEAGVDITSATMVTELAPWSSLVQRIGRCNRYGECGDRGGRVFWIDLPSKKACMPYEEAELDAARAKLSALRFCGPEALSHVPAYPPAPSAILRKRDLLDLFDTEPDLSGFDIDISPYVRDTDDTDVRLFWRVVAAGKPASDAPEAQAGEICPAPIGGARNLLKRKGVRAWRWDVLDKGWQRVGADALRPGMEILLDAASGGYDEVLGFDAASTGAVVPVNPAPASRPPAIDDDQDSFGGAPTTLAVHSGHVTDEMAQLCNGLGIGGIERKSLMDAARWHDVGKAHEAFQRSLGANPAADAEPFAKSGGSTASAKTANSESPLRPFFRHELASALAFLSAREWHRDADLTAYLVAAHHGKVRLRIRALPGEPTPPDDRMFARGVWHGDALPAVSVPGLEVPKTTLDLDIMRMGEGDHGASWAARTHALLQQHGPFRLAWLEALLRIADWRASAAEAKGDGSV
jgi:CRISPR-associated endonuclease/helicase Cas3